MKKELEERILQGYEQIAFGNVQDSIRLLFLEDTTPRMLKNMDFFNISEVKKPKGGGMEIRFFDRLEALKCMQEIGDEKNDAAGFFRALEEGAQALRGKTQ